MISERPGASVTHRFLPLACALALGCGHASQPAGAGTAPPADAAAGPTVRLIAIGDTGEGNQEQHDVAAQMDAKCAAVGGCDAVLMLGDNFYDNGVAGIDDAQWIPKFEEVY